MATKIQCPNCLGEAEREGNKVTCLSCDAIFTVTKSGPAKVKEFAWKDELERRLKALEDRQAELLGGDDDQNLRDDQDQDQPDEDQEEPILPE